MTHTITGHDLAHWGLFTACVLVLAASAVVWLYALGSMMSDTPGDEVSSAMLYGPPIVAVVLFVAWLFV